MGLYEELKSCGVYQDYEKEVFQYISQVRTFRDQIYSEVNEYKLLKDQDVNIDWNKRSETFQRKVKEWLDSLSTLSICDIEIYDLF